MLSNLKGSVTQNTGKKENTTDYRAVFTGEVSGQVVGFNPAADVKAELMGITGDGASRVRVPEYSKIADGVERLQLDIWLKINPKELDESERSLINTAIKEENARNMGNPNYTQRDLLSEESNLVDNYVFPLTLWLENKEEKSASGNFRFINHKNQSTWASEIEQISQNANMSWFDTSTARKAKVGEVLLYNFIHTWSNLANDDELDGLYLGDGVFEDLCAGNTDYLQDLMDHENWMNESGETRGITVLLGVKASEKTDANGNPYLNQRVFTNAYQNPFAKEGRSLGKKAREAAEKYFNANFQENFNFRKYDVSRANSDTPATTFSSNTDMPDDDF